MADDLHYIPGDFYRLCDRTGFKVRAGKTRKEWNGRIIRNQSWEERHPQDFVRGVPDPQVAPDPRPRQVDQFIGPLETSFLTSAPAGSVGIAVVTTARMHTSDRLSIILDNKDTFFTSIVLITSLNNITLSSALPYSASAGNLITDISAVSLPFIG